MSYVLWYLLIAVPCFVAAECLGIRLRRGFPLASAPPRLWRDYFYVHCPWSWAVARDARLADMRKFLGTDGRDHVRLGRITAADCDDPSRQEEIARKAYVSRIAFWRNAAFRMLRAPFDLAILLFILGTLYFRGVPASAVFDQE